MAIALMGSLRLDEVFASAAVQPLVPRFRRRKLSMLPAVDLRDGRRIRWYIRVAHAVLLITVFR